MLDFLRKWRQARKLAAIRVPDALWERVEARFPFLGYLEPADRVRLRELARVFLAEKEFHGAQGLEVTDEIMLGIAVQACLPVLNIGLEAYRGWVGVVVYPGDFVIPRHEVDEDGVVHEYDDEVLGEAWEGGPVLLSWHEEGLAPADVNVVIHEFAHKLDMANGEVDGLPALPQGMSRARWAAALNEAYEDFCEAVDADEETVLDPYGAEHPAEFFAVASEAFFERPCLLEEAYPAVYAQFREYYRLDPARGERRVRKALAGHGRAETDGRE